MGVRVALTSEVLKKPGQLRCVQSGVRSVCAASVSAGRCVQGPSKPIPTSCATADHRLGARHAFWTAAADTGSVPSGRLRLYRSSQHLIVGTILFYGATWFASVEARKKYFGTEQETLTKYDLLKIQLYVGPMSRLTLPRNKSFEYLK